MSYFVIESSHTQNKDQTSATRWVLSVKTPQLANCPTLFKSSKGGLRLPRVRYLFLKASLTTNYASLPIVSPRLKEIHFLSHYCYPISLCEFRHNSLAISIHNGRFMFSGLFRFISIVFSQSLYLLAGCTR